jgi:hypothetical protein
MRSAPQKTQNVVPRLVVARVFCLVKLRLEESKDLSVVAGAVSEIKLLELGSLLYAPEVRCQQMSWELVSTRQGSGLSNSISRNKLAETHANGKTT